MPPQTIAQNESVGQFVFRDFPVSHLRLDFDHGARSGERDDLELSASDVVAQTASATVVTDSETSLKYSSSVNPRLMRVRTFPDDPSASDISAKLSLFRYAIVPGLRFVDA
jgi:hypothetical protein